MMMKSVAVEICGFLSAETSQRGLCAHKSLGTETKIRQRGMWLRCCKRGNEVQILDVDGKKTAYEACKG